jgi:predicted DNA-binding transcriptional regulator AlpA
MKKPITKPTLPTARRYLPPAAAAEYAGVSPSFLSVLRMKGGGPRYVKLGKRTIKYDTADLDAWMNAKKYQSTADEMTRRRQ